MSVGIKKLKVLATVGTRPELIRLSEVLKCLEEKSQFELILVHTGQNYDYELNQIFFDELQIPKPTYFLEAAEKTAISTIGSILSKIEPVITKEQPDAFLVLGDTNSCLAAIAAKKHKVPIFHLEAGNRCFDQRVPEETNRKIVDHIADVNLCYSTLARNYLISENFPPDRVIKVGSPMAEVLNVHLPKIQDSKILNELKLEKNSYFVVSCHREENVSDLKRLEGFLKTLNKLVAIYDCPILFSAHPRTMANIKTIGIKLDEKIYIKKPLGYFDYNHLQINAKAVLSDSGTISEEASILGFNAINIRDTHERPEASEEMPVVHAGMSEERILQGISLLEKAVQINKVADYSIKNVSEKVCRIILSYTDFVNRVVWKKY